MIQYDENYYYNLLKIHTATAHEIVKRRFDFIKENIKDLPTSGLIHMLDYGSGVGFMKALAPHQFEVDTFDIMPVPTTGIRRLVYDVISMYDVLEHIPDFQVVQPVLQSGKHVVISVPVKPAEVPWKGYKHFKPGEHLHYFTDDLIEHLFDHMGFDLVAKGNPECPPRQYITSYIFKNREL
jgi:hypothetical protein